MARVGRAEISLAQGDHALAEAASARAAGAFAAMGHAALEADALRVMALARVRRGDAPGARAPLERAVALAGRAEDRLVLAECLLARAEAARARRDIGAARADAAEAVRLFELLGAAEPLADARALLADVGAAGRGPR